MWGDGALFLSRIIFLLKDHVCMDALKSFSISFECILPLSLDFVTGEVSRQLSCCCGIPSKEQLQRCKLQILRSGLGLVFFWDFFTLLLL